MTTCNSNTTTSESNAGRETPYLSASQFLAELPSTVIYAIERGLPEADLPLISDLDLVITKQSFHVLYEIANRLGMVISVTPSYGGARLFLAFDDDRIKRFDCMWRSSYMGIPICNTRHLLAERQLDKSTGLSVLAENAQAQIACAVKNAYGGAEKYRALLEQHGLEVLGTGARRRWLAALVARHPLAALTGSIRMALIYTARLVFPSGITVSGTPASTLRDSDLLCYLFQNRIREAGRFQGYIRSRLGAELCVISSSSRADLDLSHTDSLQAAEKVVLNHLCTYQSHLQYLTMAVS